MNAIVRDPITWIDVGAVTDIPLRGARRVPTPGGDVAIFRTGDGQVFALKDACPHKGGPLSQGIVHGNVVTCPLHNWNISLKTGEALGGDKGCVPTIPLKLDGGRIFLLREAVLGRSAA